tara:strand:- start:1007 stop:1474 length:468 start_codon:yes stop_codon:yes gene_type:complete
MQLNEQKKEITNKEWEHWKQVIVRVFNQYGQTQYNQRFLDEIWYVSTKVLPGLEVSVIVDGNNKLYISKGTGVFVDYTDENVAGMRIPIKCWIHTHPFGQAYFSGTDWRTINTQRPILMEAIVLGDKQSMRWENNQSEGDMLYRTEAICLDIEEE